MTAGVRAAAPKGPVVAEFYFYCYPWDLEQEGLEAATARLAGEIGVDAVSVAAVHPAVEELRPRGPAGGKTLVHQAAAYFQPAAALYTGTNIKPNVASGLKGRNPLERIALAVSKQQLRLRLALSACRNPVLAERYPMACGENAFGEKDGRWLCPSNPDVRAYVAALAEDLTTNYPATTLDLADADFGDGAGLIHFLESGVQPAELDRVLWAWCFCPSCRQRAAAAGVDVEAALRVVRERVDGMLQTRPRGYEEPAGSLPASLPELAAYQNMRIEAVSSLVELVRGRVPCRMVIEASKPVLLSGVCVQSLGVRCDGFVLRPGASEGGPVQEHPALARGVGQAGAAERTSLLLPCSPPGVGDGDALVRLVHEAAGGGFAGVGFFNYGLASEACLEWVRRAIRYARREQG